MPNHVHLLIYSYQSKYDISIILQAINGKTSYRYRDFLIKEDSSLLLFTNFELDIYPEIRDVKILLNTELKIEKKFGINFMSIQKIL